MDLALISPEGDRRGGPAAAGLDRRREVEAGPAVLV